jgi:DNA primase
MKQLGVAELKRALGDARALARALGLALARGSRPQRGSVLVACPWHKEKTPSCSISTGPDGTLRVRCFGCGASGDALTLIAEVMGLDTRREFHEVLEEAARIARIRLDGAASPRRPRSPDKGNGDAGPRAREGVSAIGRIVLHLGRLDDSPIASGVCAYLARRGLLDEAQRDGFAALPVAEFHPAWVRLLRDALERDLVDASGLLRRDAFVFPDHRLVIPWRTPDGELDTLQRRKLIGDAEPRYVFPSGVGPRFPFGVDALGKNGPDTPIAFVEGALDVLAARALYRQDGIDRVPLGLPGVNGWRREWSEFARGRAVFLAFDGDEAGDRAVGPIADDLEAAGAARVFRARPVGGKDWGAIIEARR